MASLTIKRPDLYPNTTVVKAYVLAQPRGGELEIRNRTGDPASWKPALVEKAKATAGSESVAFTIGSGAEEVPSETPLLLWAEVGGVDRYLHVRSSGGQASEPD